MAERSLPRSPHPGPLRLAAREAGVLGTLLLLYQGSRLLGGRDPEAALDSARTVLAVERALLLPAEQDLQAAVLGSDVLVRLANAFYAGAHLPVTAGVLLWLLLRHPASYRRARTALVQATTVALGVYLLLPVAPPRMLPGFVDTGAAYGQSVYGGAGGTALANEYAAVPSLHVGWAVLVALAATAATTSRWRWLWLLHPLATVVVVVATANHFWLDAVAGALLLTVTWQLARPRAEAQLGKTASTSTSTSQPATGSDATSSVKREGRAALVTSGSAGAAVPFGTRLTTPVTRSVLAKNCR